MVCFLADVISTCCENEIWKCFTGVRAMSAYMLQSCGAGPLALRYIALLSTLKLVPVSVISIWLQAC
jgi:hypothetical protein